MPQGVLIVGERGTGKTSLALAIAAEAKVPVVEVKAQQLEAGLWVGQSASNVRELFQTARDLVGYSFLSFYSVLCYASVFTARIVMKLVLSWAFQRFIRYCIGN